MKALLLLLILLMALAPVGCVKSPSYTEYDPVTKRLIHVDAGITIASRRKNAVAEVGFGPGRYVRYAVEDEDSSISVIEWFRTKLGMRSIDAITGVQTAEIGADVQKAEIGAGVEMFKEGETTKRTLGTFVKPE